MPRTGHTGLILSGQLTYPSLQVPLFANTELGFTKLLALSIKPVLFLSNEYIVRKGDVGSEVSQSLHQERERVSWTMVYTRRCTLFVVAVLTW